MRRPQTARYGVLIAVGAAIVTLITVVLATASDPAAAITTFLLGPWSNRYAFGNYLARAALLTLTGAGVVAAFRAGVFNLGGEGQVYVAALVAATALTSGNIGPFAAVVLATLSGASFAGLSGWLRHRTGADELITSFLVSSALIPIVDYLIVGPLRDPASNLLATKSIPESARLIAVLAPSQLSTAAIWSVVVLVALWFALRWTLFGYELRIVGYNRELARYAGMSVGFYTTVPMAISGALHGLAGAALVLGVHHRAILGFSGGLGWNGIAVALIARNNPVWVLPAALFFAWLEAGARAAVLGDHATWELGSLIQGVVFLFVTAHLFRRRSS